MRIRPASRDGFATIEFDEKDEQDKAILKKMLFGIAYAVKPTTKHRKIVSKQRPVAPRAR